MTYGGIISITSMTCSLIQKSTIKLQLALIDTWIQDTQFFSTGWDPYLTSLRIVNWIKFDLVMTSV